MGEKVKGGGVVRPWLRDAFIMSTFLVWPHRFLTIASCVLFFSSSKFSVIVSVIVSVIARVLFPIRLRSHQRSRECVCTH